MQAYRIAYWRVAAEEINYRRFFNINELAGLRMELPELFEETHRLVFDLIERGDVQGVRIDHIDGLFDPRAYCERLQRRVCDAALRAGREDTGALRNSAALADCRQHRLRFHQSGAGDLCRSGGRGADDPPLSPIRRARREFRRCALRLQEAHNAGEPRQRDERARARVSPPVDARAGAPATSH